MTERRSWEIWMARVYFADLPDHWKWRPVVVIGGGDVLIFDTMPITSTFREDGYRIRHWRYAGLDHESTLMYRRIYPINDEDFGRRVGSLHPGDILAVQNLITGSSQLAP